MTYGDIFVIVSISPIVLLMLRNWQVYMWRANAIDTLYSFEDWEWRREKFCTVSYDTLMWQFWRPLHSFYPSLDFLEKNDD